MSDDDVQIQLSRDEALVLGDWLYRLGKRSDFNEIVPEPSDRTVIWALEAILESSSVDIFAPDYADRLKAARRRLAPPDSDQ